MLREKYRKIKPRLDRTAHKIGEVQAKIFLTLFYYTMVPLGFAYLTLSKEIHHEHTGYFKEVIENQKDLESLRKQF